MREIKFRVWDKGKKEWIFGYDYPNLGGFSMCGEIMMMDEYSSALSHFFREDRMDDFVIMQYTGLKDNYGKEIYEGDVVCCEHLGSRKIRLKNPKKEIFSVMWGGVCDYEGTYLTEGWGLTRDGKLLDSFFHDDCWYEVIGNIFEDSHLLTTDIKKHDS